MPRPSLEPLQLLAAIGWAGALVAMLHNVTIQAGDSERIAMIVYRMQYY
jgi:hypothetical protein